MIDALEVNSVWMDKTEYADAEKHYYEGLTRLLGSKGLLSHDGSNQNPKSFVAAKKISISECDSNKQSVSTQSPKISKSNDEKCDLEKLKNEESEWITVCGKEKSSKRNKKSKDCSREMTPNSVSNKESTPPHTPKDDSTTALPPQSVDVSCKKKDAKEKANKAEKKKSNKKDKTEMKEEKPQIVEKVEEIKIVDKQGESPQIIVSGQCSLSNEIAKARQHIKNSLECMDTVMASVPNMEVVNRINTLESAMNELREMLLRIQIDVNTLMKNAAAGPAPTPPVAVCAKPPQAKPAAPKEDSDDGVDLFASDSEDDEAAAKIREERLAAYAAKKSKKPALIAKSSIILDVKPWDDETDMAEMEKRVRLIKTDGLLWGASKLVPLAFTIKKLQITCVVEDDKVSVDWLQEEIEKIEDLVQSVDIAAFNKI